MTGFTVLIGLSKERPILDHHAKAYIHEIREIRRISKDQLPGMVSPMFSFLVYHFYSIDPCFISYLGQHIYN